MSYKFKPIAIVSVVVKCQEKYLIVEEKLANGDAIYNIPSGHLEFREGLINGALRELDEESGLKVDSLDGIVGIYNFVQSSYSVIRTCFYLELVNFPELRPHDPDGDVCGVSWKTYEECLSLKKHMRSEMCIRFYKRF